MNLEKTLQWTVVSANGSYTVQVNRPTTADEPLNVCVDGVLQTAQMPYEPVGRVSPRKAACAIAVALLPVLLYFLYPGDLASKVAGFFLVAVNGAIGVLLVLQRLQSPLLNLRARVLHAVAAAAWEFVMIHLIHSVFCVLIPALLWDSGVPRGRSRQKSPRGVARGFLFEISLDRTARFRYNRAVQNEKGPCGPKGGCRARTEYPI